jgi:hypothetical protein
MEDNAAAFPPMPEIDLEIFSLGCIIDFSNEWTWRFSTFNGGFRS